MKTPHKHAALIKAWADGAEIEVKNSGGYWVGCIDPYWSSDAKYRIKPEPKPDVVRYACCDSYGDGLIMQLRMYRTKQDITELYVDQLKLTFDGETFRLKSAEVI